MATALTIGAGLFGAAGSVMQGRAQAAAYEQQAKIAQQNARLAQLQGERELEKGAREEQRFRRQARQFQSTQRAQLAASGSQLAGSNLNVLADTASGIEQDASMLRFNTLQNKYERDIQALNFRNEANAAMANASNAKSAGLFGGFTTLLSTGARIAGMTAGAQSGADTSGHSIKIKDSIRPWQWDYNRLRGRSYGQYRQSLGYEF